MNVSATCSCGMFTSSQEQKGRAFVLHIGNSEGSGKRITKTEIHSLILLSWRQRILTYHKLHADTTETILYRVGGRKIDERHCYTIHQTLELRRVEVVNNRKEKSETGTQKDYLIMDPTGKAGKPQPASANTVGKVLELYTRLDRWMVKIREDPNR
eukprot:scaffold414_cov109-Cylindrotheca_fusiformis.AAC.14